jgi:hypothetical protein
MGELTPVYEQFLNHVSSHPASTVLTRGAQMTGITFSHYSLCTIILCDFKIETFYEPIILPNNRHRIIVKQESKNVVKIPTILPKFIERSFIGAIHYKLTINLCIC